MGGTGGVCRSWEFALRSEDEEDEEAGRKKKRAR